MGFPFDTDEENLKDQEKAFQQKKNTTAILGSLSDRMSSGNSFGNYWLGKLNQESTAGRDLAANLNKGDSPMERQAKAFEYLKSKRANKLAVSSDAADSPDSLAMQEQIGSLFPALKGVVAGKSKTQIEQMMPLLTAKIKGDQERETARIAAGTKAQEKADLKAEKAALDQKERTTQFGVARTPDDAKKLKDAAELKASFDSKLQEMIELRKKHGGEVMNREAVNRGKSLANDLLLAYKDLSKLGVMSKTDEAILRSIIPADPLQFNSPLAAVQGQDPTLNQMEKFKGDAERDFQERLKNRLENYAGAPQEKTVVKQERNKKTGQVRITYSDGSQEIKSTAGL